MCSEASIASEAFASAFVSTGVGATYGIVDGDFAVGEDGPSFDLPPKTLL
jgi:hypothetical protein